MPFIPQGNARLEGHEDRPGPQRPARAMTRHMFARWMNEIAQNIWTTNSARVNFALGTGPGPQTFRNVMAPNVNRTVASGTVENPLPGGSTSARNQIANNPS